MEQIQFIIDRNYTKVRLMQNMYLYSYLFKIIIIRLESFNCQ